MLQPNVSLLDEPAIKADVEESSRVPFDPDDWDVLKQMGRVPLKVLGERTPARPGCAVAAHAGTARALQQAFGTVKDAGWCKFALRRSVERWMVP